MVGFAELHDELRDQARDILGGAGRRPIAVGALEWEDLARAGWLGLEVPPSLEGAGATFAETAVVLEEMGRAAARYPYLGHALAVGALLGIASGATGDDLLRGLATGKKRTALVLPTGDDEPEATQFVLTSGAGGTRLAGAQRFIPDAPCAERLLVIAADPTGGLVVADIAADSPGLRVEEQIVIDQTRRFAVVTAEQVVLAPGSVHPLVGGAVSARRLHQRAALAVAWDSLGLAEAMLEATVAYAGVRRQFGRAIGSFQAVQHACADMLVKVTLGRELLEGATDSLVAEDDDAGPLVAMAKSHVCSAAVEVVGKAMQLHGGIGYTWDGGIHAYLKRAALNRSLFGSPTSHRRRIARRYDGGEVAAPN
ncbi:MAG TPA: acyl-CoA dehydrogenase family protein [Acidimicrobiales bacterium]|nr:acyl-CoA dehydrogenase family protein [Acidimicrobiales bacterium]